MPNTIINQPRGVVLNADTQPHLYEQRLEDLEGVGGVVGVKISAEVAMGLTLREAVQLVIKHSLGMTIYDHQTAGNDTEKTATSFARAMRAGRVDAAILRPLASLGMGEYWVNSLQEQDVKIIVGDRPIMPIEDNQKPSQYLIKDDTRKIFDLAFRMGINNLAIHGNTPEMVVAYREYFEKEYGQDYVLYIDGITSGRTNLMDIFNVAGDNWHPMIGRAILDAPSPKDSAIKLAHQATTGERK